MVLVISNPCKIKFKSIFNVKLNKKTIKRPVDTSSSHCDKLSYLPEEVLLNIFVHLENPTQFICTSRYLASISCSSRFTAHWIYQRYGRRYALYCALTRHPQICDDKLVQCLIQLGVDMPRYLLQMFIETYRGPRRASVKSSKSGNSCQSEGKLTEFADAISHIPFSGYAAMISAAWEKYGDVFPSEDSDFSLFTSALGDGKGGLVDQQELERLIQEYKFIPLPLPEQMISKCFFRLAEEEDSSVFELIVPSFCVDKHARYRIWERAILDAIDYSFSATDSLNARKVNRLHSISKCLEGLPLGGMKEEYEIFILAINAVFTRYPTGYISSTIIAKAFHLIDTHIKPGLAHWTANSDIKNNESISPAIQDGFAKFLVTMSSKP
ncbi:hypothetical protein Unana1_01985 [Umbelopsis nana]